MTVVALALYIAWLLIIAWLLLRRQRKNSAARSAATFAVDLTTKEIEQNIREDAAPDRRPYGSGAFGNDSAGKSYIAGEDGAIRRVVIVKMEDDREAILVAKKMNKGQRKKRKKELRAAKQQLALKERSVQRRAEPETRPQA